jgi:hypothetical protein
MKSCLAIGHFSIPAKAIQIKVMQDKAKQNFFELEA